jgi:uncharacterized protein (TIGR03435 family)
MRITAILFALLVTIAEAQSPTFEVASVKPSAPNSNFSTWGYGPGATVRFLNVGLRPIIADAYDLDMNAATGGGEYRLVGGPDALLHRPFDIEARAPAGATQAEKKAMLRTLLADRFKLRIRKETRQVALYALTMAGKEFGPGFKRSNLDCNSDAARDYRQKNPAVATPCNVLRTEATRSSYAFRGAGPMSSLLRQMQSRLDRPLVDQTGLSGNFEWATKFRLSPTEGEAPVFVDAVRQDLGLRITPTKGPFDVLVIDSVEMPSEN